MAETADVPKDQGEDGIAMPAINTFRIFSTSGSIDVDASDPAQARKNAKEIKPDMLITKVKLLTKEGSQ